MKLSEIADILTAIGSLLVGIASIITATKKKPSERKVPKARKFK